MSESRNITLPMTPETARSLKLGDMVTLTGVINSTAGIPTLARIIDHLDRGEDLPVDLHRAAFFHLGSSMVEKDGAFEIQYLNPTTSTRFNPVMPRIIRELNLSCVGGKGGLNSECAQALKEVGGVYFSFLGGGSPLLSDAIERVVEVAWQDMYSHYRLAVIEMSKLGPLTVAIDAHGNSLYDNLTSSALERRDEILANLTNARGVV